METRQAWIDYIKVIGMFMIVWGHCFPPLYSRFLYAVNVPLFFFVSGYLYKEKSFGNLFKKTIATLLIPYLIFSACILVDNIVCKSVFNGCSDILFSFCGILLGCHTFAGVPSAGVMWFVYTLILIRLIKHFIPQGIMEYVSLVIASLLMVYVSAFCKEPNTISPLLSIPSGFFYFTIGVFAKRYLVFDRLKANTILDISITAIALFVYLLLSNTNGEARLFRGYMSDNLVQYVIASLGGILLICRICQLKCFTNNRFIMVLSSGSLVILATHNFMIDFSFRILNFSSHYCWKTLLISMAIMFISYWLILLVSKYIPVLLGGRRIN